jgi:hypothetical protein
MKLNDLKIKPKTCRECKCKYVPYRALSPVCEKYECKVAYAMKSAEKSALAREKKAKREHKVKLEKIKTRQEHLRDAQRFFNLYIRTRDAKENCICCNRNSNQDTGIYGHAWDAGHYRSIGSAPHLRFNENNVHKQLVFCNRYGSGKAVDYRIGLIARIGLEAVEALEADQTPKHYTIEEIQAIKAKYKQMTKELKNAS